MGVLGQQSQKGGIVEEEENREGSSMFGQDVTNDVLDTFQIVADFCQFIVGGRGDQFGETGTSLCSLDEGQLGYLFVDLLCVFEVYVIRQFLDVQQLAQFLDFHQPFLHCQPLLQGLLTLQQRFVADRVLLQGLRVRIRQSLSHRHQNCIQLFTKRFPIADQVETALDFHFSHQRMPVVF